MKIIRGIGKVIKPLVNFPAWMGWNQIKVSGNTIKEAAKLLADQPKSHRQENFQQAIARLRLSEADLAQRMTFFKRMAFFYLLVAIGLFGYAVYMVIGEYWAAALLSTVLTVLAAVLALRQHFWYYQMKKRKLGCTLKEWWQDTFNVRGA